MKISVNGKTVVVTLRAWSETQERWEQDFFGDVETLDFDRKNGTRAMRHGRYVRTTTKR